MVSKLKIIVYYISYGGNTKEVANLICDSLQGNDVTIHRIGSGKIPDPAPYDIVFIGTFTWVNGSVPDEMKDFVWDVGYKPPYVALFGTGDTQFGGDELFCNAVTKLAKFYNSPFTTLKIEQSPRESQEKLVKDWTEGVIDTWVKNSNK